MKISGWALTSVSRTKFTRANMLGVGKVAVDASGKNDGIHISGKDDAGRHISIELDAEEIRRVLAFVERVSK